MEPSQQKIQGPSSTLSQTNHTRAQKQNNGFHTQQQRIAVVDWRFGPRSTESDSE